MGEITVRGLGKVRIKGDTPDEEETKAIMDALGVREPPTLPAKPAVPGVGITPATPEMYPNPVPYIEEVTSGFVSRPAAEALGGTVGAVAGAGTGPVSGPAGMLAGATLGAGAGSATFDIADAIARQAKGMPPRPESALAPTERALEAMKQEFMWTGGASALGPVFRAIKPTIGKALGVGTPEAARLQRMSEGMDIPLGVIQATGKKTVKGFSRVLGVFPFVGTPIKRAAKESGEAVTRYFDDTLNTLAPNATIADLGVDLVKAAGKRFDKFKSVAGSLYDDFFKKASALSVPDIFPTENVTRAAIKITGKAKAGDIILQSGKPLRSPLPDPLDEFITDLADLPKHVTAEQYRGLQLELQDVIKKLGKDGYNISRAIELKKALEIDFNMPDLSRLAEKEARGVVSALTRANTFYARAIRPFETKTAGRFGRADKNIFRGGAFKAGSIDEDEVFKAVFNSKSPKSIDDLRNLVGPAKFRQATRKWLGLNFASAGESGTLDIGKFANSVGFGAKEGEQALEAMLKGTDISVKDMNNFIDVARAAGEIPLPDTSTFIARRLTLGGFKSLLGGLAMGGAVFTDPIKGGAGILLVRYGSKILSNPKHLKAMTRALKDTTSDKQARALLIRTARALIGTRTRESLISPQQQETTP